MPRGKINANQGKAGMTMRNILMLGLLGALVAASAAAQPAGDMLRGKTVTVFIGFSAGGGYDTYARLVARHIGKYLPGSPTVIPQNMPGAGSLTLANHIYNVAPKDGTAIGSVEGGILFEALYNKNSPIKFDPRKFTWVGGVNREVSTCQAWHSSPVTKFSDAFKKPMTVGGTGPGGDPYLFPRILNSVLHTKFKLVSGYPGTNEIFLAMEKGELDGICGWYWSSVKAVKNDWLEQKKIVPLVQLALHKHPSFPDVPLVLDFAKTPEDRKVLEITFAPMGMGRPYLAPPGLSNDRRDALRTAFAKTMKDKDLLAEAKKAKLEINPTTGDEIEGIVAEIYAAPKSVIERAAAARK
jgi:tripartite-type tricarboxylate transporter receptor subunit TctC